MRAYGILSRAGGALNYEKYCAIVSHQRSGTHLLGSCLDSHPDVSYVDEIFLHKRFQDLSSVLRFVSKFDGHERICVDAKYNQISKPVEEFLKRIRVIHLVRRDIKRMYFSDLLHRFYNVRGTTEERLLLYQKIAMSRKELPEIPFNQKGFNRYLEQVENGRQKYGYLGGLTLYYEDLTSNESITSLPEESTRKICEFLGIEYHPLTTSRIKFSPIKIPEDWK